jgi:hypothetical protein
MRGDPGGSGSSSGGSDGFSVDPASLDGAAGQLGRAYDDLGVAMRVYDADSDQPGTAFGDFGVPDAWVAFDADWALELKTTHTALAELIRKVEQTSRNYRTADQNVRLDMQSLHTRLAGRG